MKQILGAFRRTSYGTVAALFLLTAIAVALPAQTASAATLEDRSLQLSSSRPSGEADLNQGGGVTAPAGSAANGDKVSHTYKFKAGTTGNIKAVVIQYCSSAFGYLFFDSVAGATCGAVTGFSADDAGQAVVTNITDPGTQTFATVTNSANTVKVTNATGVDVTAGDEITVVFTADATNFFVNPSVASTTFFGHIETYAAETAVQGTSVDEGTVTSASANDIAIETRVQETLKFSVGNMEGAETTASAKGTACDALTGTGVLKMGDAVNNALDPTQTYTAKSFFRISTNAGSGAQVLYSGQTLQSTAGDTITAFAAGAGTEAAAATGQEQFGLGIDVTDTATGYDVTQLVPDTDYDTAGTDFYAFNTASATVPEPIAASSGFITCDTGVVKYAANVANDTEAGIYTTKISYIAVPTY